ncbi:hypothetical protein F5Y16DRAFT_401392 [Xylariaceae sp. FL0255]|nr:hypothetical protein F5Y16DRAFT_401392 [Xylariaceae sp. FL0255]
MALTSFRTRYPSLFDHFRIEGFVLLVAYSLYLHDGNLLTASSLSCWTSNVQKNLSEEELQESGCASLRLFDSSGEAKHMLALRKDISILDLGSRKTPRKHSHSLTTSSPSERSTATQGFTMTTFEGGPYSTLMPSGRSASEINTAHRARVAAHLQALEARLPQQQ